MTIDWTAWQQRWDRQQQGHRPDREACFAFMLQFVGAATGTDRPRVLDLACGPGSIAARLLKHHPGARVVAVDLDPVLLRIAEGVFAGDHRVKLVEADLRSRDWMRRLPEGRFQAALTATALHWLEPEDLARLYHDLVRLLEPGGVFCNADLAPLPAAPRLLAAGEALLERERRAAFSRPDTDDWDRWWRAVAAEPAFADDLAERGRRFARIHPAEFMPPADWHLRNLRAAGFSEAEVVWRRLDSVVITALR